MQDKKIEQAYSIAKQRYSQLGVDTEKAIKNVQKVAVSIHCWQGDDVGGFEQPDAQLAGGGIQATGNYPGKARNINELRMDVEKVLSLVPGNHRLNLHAVYLDNKGKFVDRDKIGPEHFESWVHWAQNNKLGLDFNPTFFSHEKAADGLTLSHPDKGIRNFWIDHGKACRKIADFMGAKLNNTAVMNTWIPDGSKDIPFDRLGPRKRLLLSLDEMFADKMDKNNMLDAVESKLFGIGAESYTVGSHEFYTGYAVSRELLLCLDSGHFHPTEFISDKLSAVMLFVPEILLHVSRPVRWDSDHVVIMDDELKAIAQQLVRADMLDKVHIGLDFFDASINRIAAWVIGTRNMIKALLFAMLEPAEELMKKELAGDFTSRLAILEELRTMPFAAVWDQYCLQNDVPVALEWLDQVKKYEKNVLAERN